MRLQGPHMLLSALLFAAASAMAGVQPEVEINPFSLRKGLDISKPAETLKVPRRVVKKLRPFYAPSWEKEYTGAFQSFYENYEFMPQGGEFLTYNVSISIDGSVAVVKNLFNLASDGYSTDEDISGVYDEESNTIIIPTSTIFDEATVGGYIYGYYKGVVVAGTVGEDAMFTPDNELVIKLSDDKQTAAISQNFGVMSYTPEGSAQGFAKVYKGAVLSLDTSEPSILCFSDSMSFTRCYVGDQSESNLKVFNFSDSPATLSVSSDSENFKVSVSEVAIEPMAYANVGVTFNPTSMGVATGNLTMSSGSQTISVEMKGEGIEMPDYSYIQKTGDMDILTGADYPFEKIDIDGISVAHSANGVPTNASSFLMVYVEVPEGHTGKLSWKGKSNSEVAYASIPSILTDDVEVSNYAGLLDADITGDQLLSPGAHYVTFNFMQAWDSYAGPNDGLYVYDLEFVTEKLEDNKANLLSEEVIFPNSLLNDGNATKQGVISIRNEGGLPLRVNDIDNSTHFKAQAPELEAKTLEVLEIPVEFTATEEGEYSEELTLTTTAGEFKVECKALVREMPDFNSIVKQGEFRFVTDEQNPFLVKDGKAYNSTSKITDKELTYCTLTAYFNVPEGMIGKLAWNGRLSCAGEGPNGWTDYLSIKISTSRGMQYVVVPGEHDLNTDLFPYIDTPDFAALLCGEGDCELSFTYIQYGDSNYGGEDLVEIYDLSLELKEDEGGMAILKNDRVDFGELYNGKSKSAKIEFYNAGMEPLEIFNVIPDDCFDAIIPDYTVPYNQYLNMTVLFEPYEVGYCEGVLLIETSAGDFEVTCTGTSLSTDEFVIIEDFEDDAANWRIYDRDGDGDNWNLAWNVYGGFPQSHVHSGEECLVSFSWDYISGSFTPDNWTFSPQFEVPETGAFLSWWSAGEDNSRAGDVYSVYVCDKEYDYDNSFSIEDYDCIYTETIDSDEWANHVIDLSAYSGKTVHVAFRHHDSEGFYLVRIDDVFVYKDNPVAIDFTDASKEIVDRNITTVDGRSLDRLPEKGVVVVTTRYADGSVTSRKLIR